MTCEHIIGFQEGERSGDESRLVTLYTPELLQYDGYPGQRFFFCPLCGVRLIWSDDPSVGDPGRVARGPNDEEAIVYGEMRLAEGWRFVDATDKRS